MQYLPLGRLWPGVAGTPSFVCSFSLIWVCDQENKDIIRSNTRPGTKQQNSLSKMGTTNILTMISFVFFNCKNIFKYIKEVTLLVNLSSGPVVAASQFRTRPWVFDTLSLVQLFSVALVTTGPLSNSLVLRFTSEPFERAIMITGH